MAYLFGVLIASGGFSFIPSNKIFAQAPNQLHIIGIGCAGGLFGATWIKPLKMLLKPNT